MDSLFDSSKEVNQDIFRNVVSLRESEDLFDDLTDGDSEMTDVAMRSEMRVKANVPPGLVSRGFHYTTAIAYPFTREPYLFTRFGDGSFPVWYGSFDWETTVYETAYHMQRFERAVEHNGEPVYRERAVYTVRCDGIFIDLSHKVGDFPQLVSDEYEFTHQVGRRLQRMGHPGLIARSARAQGDNLAAFNPTVLSDPRNFCYLSYEYSPLENSIQVCREPGVLWRKIQFN